MRVVCCLSITSLNWLKQRISSQSPETDCEIFFFNFLYTKQADKGSLSWLKKKKNLAFCKISWYLLKLFMMFSIINSNKMLWLPCEASKPMPCFSAPSATLKGEFPYLPSLRSGICSPRCLSYPTSK